MKKVLSNLFDDYSKLCDAVVILVVSALAGLMYHFIAYKYFPTAVPTIWEVVGVVFNLACVYLVIKQNNWQWVYGIIAVLFFGYALYEYQLYSTAVLNIVYFLPVQLYGWYWWVHGGVGKIDNVIPKWADNITRVVSIGLIGIFVAGWGTLLSTYTDAVFVYLDAGILAISVVAQMLLSWKKIDCWIGWIAVNIMSVVLYTMVGAYMAAGLYGLFLVLASIGFYKWVTDPRRG